MKSLGTPKEVHAYQLHTHIHTVLTAVFDINLDESVAP